MDANRSRLSTKGKAKPVVFVISLFLVLSLLVGGLGSFVFLKALDSTFENADPVIFTVQSGESGSSVSLRLNEQGIIDSEWLFPVLLKLPGNEKGLKSGTYRILPGMKAGEIFSLLFEGKQLLERVRITEGHENSKIALMLDQRGLYQKKDFLAACSNEALLAEFGIQASTCEGYLFPDTYLIPTDFPVTSFVRMMITRFFEVLHESLPETKSMSGKEIHDGVILASIVEREYRAEEEAPVIAGVFKNRLDINMALQSCATVVYVITEHLGRKHPEMLYFSDIEIKDPYNTYINNGLPPGPISNPGKVALFAAFRPEKTDYLYFRLMDQKTGKHYFSHTLDEHNKASSFLVKTSQ